MCICECHGWCLGLLPFFVDTVRTLKVAMLEKHHLVTTSLFEGGWGGCQGGLTTEPEDMGQES